MDLLSKDEEYVLRVIIKHARIDYFRRNNLYSDIEDIEEYDIETDENIENRVIENDESDIKANSIEKYFSEEKIFKVTKTLKYDEKLLLFLFYIEEKSDKEIAEILSTTWKAVRSKRMRIIQKIRKMLQGGYGNV